MELRYPDLNKYKEYDAIADSSGCQFRITKEHAKPRALLDLKTGKVSTSIVITERQLSNLVDLILDYLDYIKNKPEPEEF